MTTAEAAIELSVETVRSQRICWYEHFPPSLESLIPGADHKQARNRLAHQSLEAAVQHGQLACMRTKGVDHRRLFPLYTGRVYSSELGCDGRTLAELADAITLDLRAKSPTKCEKAPLWCLPAELNDWLELHASGQSQMLDHHASLGSFRALLKQSQVPALRAAEQSLTWYPPIKDVATHVSAYVGDADIVVDAGEPIRLLGCFFGKLQHGESACEPYLQRLFKRLADRRSWLCSVRGFSAFYEEYGRWPKGTIDLENYYAPAKGEAMT